MDYFRAVLLTQEYSPRTLALTANVIDLNAANYTAWHFRRQCLKAMGSDLTAELAFVASIAGDNPKNYQIWPPKIAKSGPKKLTNPGQNKCQMLFQNMSQNALKARYGGCTAPHFLAF